MKKHYKVNLMSKKSVEDIVSGLTAYRDGLQTKLRLICQRLTEIGINVANAKVDESPLGKYVVIQSDSAESRMMCVSRITATGEVREVEGREPFSLILAIEFGAGIHYNRGNEHPNPNQLGYGVGTYPKQIHAFEEGWYFWDEKTNEWRYSHGVKATMPMYEAIMEAYRQAEKIVMEVFKSA